MIDFFIMAYLFIGMLVAFGLLYLIRNPPHKEFEKEWNEIRYEIEMLNLAFDFFPQMAGPILFFTCTFFWFPMFLRSTMRRMK